MTIWFIWQAGMWINTAWLLLMQLLSHKWYTTYWDKEYQSIIKWWTNLFIVYISEKEPYISNKIDHLIVFDPTNENKTDDSYKIQNKKLLYKLSKTKPINIVAFAFACKLLWISDEEWINELNDYFSSKPKFQENNLTAFNEWFSLCESSVCDYADSIWTKKAIRFGNEAIWKWAIDWWLDFYSAYPMTPASTLINVITNPKLASRKPAPVFFQWEDEIAVAMSMLWAVFAGKSAMCGTSWWWFTLMTESISFANQAELWWVYVLSQRDGPSTGTPTFTGQWDLLFACNASFGDTKPIVIAPSNLENAYTLIQKALQRSPKYKHPIIFLIDKQLSEGYLTMENTVGTVQKTVHNNNLWEDLKMITSYEHDEHWATNEDPKIKKMMADKRLQKIKNFQQNEFGDSFKWYEIINPNAKKFFISFGMNEIAIKSTISKNSDWWAIIIHIIQPSIHQLKQRFVQNENGISKLIFVEMNQLGQFEQVIRYDYNLMWKERDDKVSHFRKYTLYPIFEEELEKVI